MFRFIVLGLLLLMVKSRGLQLLQLARPTPKDRASNQRMTPNGISTLYYALERETCLSEIRSITGDNVVSGAMTPTNELRLLDLTKLELVEPPQLNTSTTNITKLIINAIQRIFDIWVLTVGYYYIHYHNNL